MIRSMPDWSRCSLRPYPALSLFLRFASAPSLVASSLRAACATPFNCRRKWPKICQFQRLGLQAQAAGMWRYFQRYHKRQLQSKAPKVLNPLVFSCEANESVVGHVSRISRRVSSRTVSGRVLDRICIKTKLLAKKFKAKLRHRHRSQWCRRRKAAERQSKGSVGLSEIYRVTRHQVPFLNLTFLETPWHFFGSWHFCTQKMLLA